MTIVDTYTMTSKVKHGSSSEPRTKHSLALRNFDARGLAQSAPRPSNKVIHISITHSVVSVGFDQYVA